jgi:hypothetical protein
MCHPLTRLPAVQALALNDKLLRMELEVSVSQQRQQQYDRQHPPLPALYEEPLEGRPRGSGAAAARANKGSRVPSMHNLDRTRVIERENAHLLSKISEISAGPRSHAGSQTSSQRVANPKRATTPRRGSETINRERNEKKIALENARIANRLAGARPLISYFKDTGRPGRFRGPREETRREREERHAYEKYQRELQSARANVRCSLPAVQPLPPPRLRPSPPPPAPAPPPCPCPDPQPVEPCIPQDLMGRSSTALQRKHPPQPPQPRAKEPARNLQRDNVTVEELRSYLASLRASERQADTAPRDHSPPPPDRRDNFLVREVGRSSNDAGQGGAMNATLSPRRPLTAEVLSRHEAGRPPLREVQWERSWDQNGRERPPPALPHVPTGYRSIQATPRGENLRQARILSTLDIASPRVAAGPSYSP